MNRFLRLPIEVVPGPPPDLIMTIFVGQSSLLFWCMELYLLEKNMSESLTIADQQDIRIKIQLNSQIEKSQRGNFKRQGNHIQLAITQTELEVWINYFLKYYCNGIAEVDHLDVELQSDESTSQELFLIFKVEDSVEPLSENDARRHLNLS